MSENNIRVVVLISGRGSNLQSIIDASRNGEIPAVVVGVVSNVPDVLGLKRAQDAGIDTQVVNHRDYEDRSQYDQALADAVDGYRPDLVVLAGFMRVLTTVFVARFEGRLINIHPHYCLDSPD